MNKLARSSADTLLQRMARSPLKDMMPDVLSATLSIAASTRAEPLALIVAMMSGFASVYATSSAPRVEESLNELARELAALDEDARADLHEEEFLHLLRDLIVHSGRRREALDRVRLRRVLLHGLRTREPLERTRLFFDLTTRLSDSDVQLLVALSRHHATTAVLALRGESERAMALAVLEREGLVTGSDTTQLGRQLLRWLEEPIAA